MSDKLGSFSRLSKYAKYGMPVCLLLYLLLPLYGLLSPWPPAEQALSIYSGQKPIMVGFSYNDHFSSNIETKRISRSYILFPMVLSEPMIVTVLQVNETGTVVSSSGYDFIFYVVWFVIFLVGTWFFWLRSKPANSS